MAQLVKCMPRRHEGLSSTCTPHIKNSAAFFYCQDGGSRGRRILEA